MMRIVLNTRTLSGPRAGIGHYTEQLARGLAARQEVQLFCFDGTRWFDGLYIPEASVGASASRLAALPGAYALRQLREQRRFRAGLSVRRVDLYHDPSLWPLDFDGPTVMTVHDLCHLRYPKTQPAARIRYMRQVFPRALERCERIITDTEVIRQEILSRFPLSPEKIHVIPLGVSSRFKPRATSDESPLPANLRHGEYFLCVGTLEPRKNLPLVMAAHACLPVALQTQFPLVIVGSRGWKDKDILRHCDRPGVIRLGYLPDDAVAHLVANARALLFPSIYEGFGLPVLEAMASGTLVVISGESAPREIAGDAALIASASDAEAWTTQMKALIDTPDRFAEQRKRGLARALQYSWDHCIEATTTLYEEVIREKSSRPA